METAAVLDAISCPNSMHVLGSIKIQVHAHACA